jgi:hypothetical protein
MRRVLATGARWRRWWWWTWAARSRNWTSVDSGRRVQILHARPACSAAQVGGGMAGSWEWRGRGWWCWRVRGRFAACWGEAEAECARVDLDELGRRDTRGDAMRGGAEGRGGAGEGAIETLVALDCDRDEGRERGGIWNMGGDAFALGVWLSFRPCGRKARGPCEPRPPTLPSDDTLQQTASFACQCQSMPWYQVQLEACCASCPHVQAQRARQLHASACPHARCSARRCSGAVFVWWPQPTASWPARVYCLLLIVDQQCRTKTTLLYTRHHHHQSPDHGIGAPCRRR